MPGYGSVSVGTSGTGGHAWTSLADTGLDFWVSALPAAIPATNAAPIYSQYADATGHAPMLREDAMIFWQSRNRYMTSKIALDVADHYKQLDLPVGVLVIDYKNQVHDGDFLPDPACFPDLNELQTGIRAAINATTVISFWPEVMKESNEFDTLQKEGCLINPDLTPGALAIDPTTAKCRDFIWDHFVKPRYFDKGTVLVFRQKCTLEDAIGYHACSLEANKRVTNCIPLGSSPQ
jgi:alpha-D-xyloside xylohydrolase